METSRPTGLRLYWLALKGSIEHIKENDISLVAAGVAYFAMLSLFPAMAALISLLGMVSDPTIVVAQLEEIRPLLPNDVYNIINYQVVKLVSARTDTLGWAGLFSVMVAVWLARAGVGAMILGLNNVYDQRNRGAARHFLRAILLAMGLILTGIIALLTIVVAPVVLAFIPLGARTVMILDIIRFAVALIILFTGVGMLYRFGPNRRPSRMPFFSFGAIVAVFSWAAMSFAFSYYVANFGNYNQVYGSIGAAIAMLVWLWLSSFLVLFGGSLNAQIEVLTGRNNRAEHGKTRRLRRLMKTEGARPTDYN